MYLPTGGLLLKRIGLNQSFQRAECDATKHSVYDNIYAPPHGL